MYNVLEEFGFELVVLNAQHMKAVPERKTEVKDSESICDLLRHGLLRASFIPSKEQRERRELVRYRKTMIRERADEVNRIQKVLEGANIKPAAVATDVLGVSGRQMLEAMIEGVQDLKLLAAMAKGRLQAKQAALEAALAGIVGEHQRFLLWEQLSHLGELHARIERLSQESEKRTRPFEEAVQLQDRIPGGGARRRLRRWWPRSERTWAAFGVPRTLLPGRLCARVTTRAPASARAVGHARATHGCERRWWRRRGRPPAPKERISARSITASPPGEEPSRPPSP